MPSIQDPEGAEIQALAAAADLSGRRVLEVGCGDGRLTRRYAHTAASVLAIDSDEEAIRTAREDLPPELRDKVRFAAVSALELEEPPASFDVGLLAWSL